MMEGRWCVLRTAGASTLSLARSLQAAGYAVWTPQRVEKRRKTDTRKGDRPVAIMPTFVFAPASDAYRLFDEARNPGSSHPDFSIFRFNGKVPLIADRELEKLRTEERKVTPKERRRIFLKQQRVKVPEGPFAGMSGVVEQGDGKWTLVAFPGSKAIKIATFLLVEDVLPAVSVSHGMRERVAA